MQVTVQDRQTYQVQASQRKVTDEGYLVVPGRAARTGIQHYLAAELGLTDRNPNDIVNVYRPPEEVFSADSLSSYDNKDVTNEHPDDLVNSKTFKSVAVGHTISIGRQDGDYVVVDMMIKDHDTIEAVNSGKAELSAGYLAEYAPEKGVTQDGQEYEFVQRGIRINHVAIVSAARAGNQARLLDHSTKETKMFQATLDGKRVSFADEASATLAQSVLDAARERAEGAERKVADAQAERDRAMAAKDSAEEKLQALEAKASDAAIAERVDAVLKVSDSARKLVGDKFTSDSMDPAEIRRQAMATIKPSLDWASKSDDYVAARFDAAMEEKEEEAEKAKATGDSHLRFGQAIADAKPDEQGQATLDASYQAYVDRKMGRAAKEAK